MFSSKSFNILYGETSVANPDPGYGIRCFFDPWIQIRDPNAGSGMGNNSDPGWTSQIIFPRAYKQFFGLKMLKFSDADSESFWLGIRDEKIRIRDPDPQHWVRRKSVSVNESGLLFVSIPFPQSWRWLPVWNIAVLLLILSAEHDLWPQYANIGLLLYPWVAFHLSHPPPLLSKVVLYLTVPANYIFEFHSFFLI